MEESTKNRFVSLATSAIKNIDEFRSITNDIQNVNRDDASTKPTESRVNTFYRIIGLPSLSNITDKSGPDSRAHGNLFVSEEDYNILIDEIVNRDNKFINKISDEDAARFQDFNTDPVKVGVEGTRLKGSLFPMVVNGNVNVLPQERRVAGAFFKSDRELIVSKTKYTRPLIETIILMRTKGIGLVDQVEQTKVDEDFDAALQDLGLDTFQLRAIEIEILRVLTKMVLSDKGISAFVNNTISAIERVRQEDERAVLDGGSDLAPEEQKKEASASGEGQLEARKKQRETVKASTDLRLQILEYDDALSEQTTKNAKEAALASILLGLITSESEEVLDDIAEEETRDERVKQEVRNSNKKLDLILGSYAGISGVDIFVIITALFSIPIENLLGLVNEQAMERLKVLRTSNLPSRASVLSSVDVLQQKVTEIYDSLNDKIINSEQFKDVSEGEENSAPSGS